MNCKSFDIYNFYCLGETLLTEASSPYLGVIEITLPGVGKVRIEIERECLESPKENRFKKTGLLTIFLNDEKSEEHNTIAKDLCSLLSFAMNGHVEYRECTAKNSFFKPVGMISHGGWRKVVISQFGEHVRHFIESCWESYGKEKGVRRLFETIRLLIQINETQDFIEQKIALASVMLENLKHTYALQNENYKCDRNKFFLMPKNKKDAPLSFRELLTDMVNEVCFPSGYKEKLSSIVKNRNNIIHQGLLGESYEDMWQQYEDMVSFIRVYLLSLLNFKGGYRSFDDPRTIKFME